MHRETAHENAFLGTRFDPAGLARCLPARSRRRPTTTKPAAALAEDAGISSGSAGREDAGRAAEAAGRTLAEHAVDHGRHGRLPDGRPGAGMANRAASRCRGNGRRPHDGGTVRKCSTCASSTWSRCSSRCAAIATCSTSSNPPRGCLPLRPAATAQTLIRLPAIGRISCSG